MPSCAIAQYTRGPAQVMALTAPAMTRQRSSATNRPLCGPHRAVAAFSATGTIGSWASVPIGTANNTLSGIAQAINAANAGVTATVLNDGTTNHLVLSSNSSGTTGTIQVGVTQTGTGATHNLTDFNYAGTNTATMVQ